MPIYGAVKFGNILEQRHFSYDGCEYNSTVRRYGEGKKAIQTHVECPFEKKIITEVTPDYTARITKDKKSIYTIVTDLKINKVVVQDAHIFQHPKDKIGSIFRLLIGTAKTNDVPFVYSERFRRNVDGSTSKFSISPLGTRKLVLTDKNNVEVIKQRNVLMVVIRKLWRSAAI